MTLLFYVDIEPARLLFLFETAFIFLSEHLIAMGFPGYMV